MKRIAVIAPFILALALDASAGIKVNSPTAAKPKRPTATRVSCWVAEIGDPQGENDSLHVGCFRTQIAAAEECAAHPYMTCQVYGLSKPHNHKVGGGK